MNKRERIQVSIRQGDTLIRDHFKNIAEGDQAHEARRLIKKALEIEQKEKETSKS